MCDIYVRGQRGPPCPLNVYKNAFLRRQRQRWRGPPVTSGPVHLVAYGVVFGELDPLVGLHTGGAQVLHAVHAEARRLRVVLTGHAQLQGGNEYRVRLLNY